MEFYPLKRAAGLVRDSGGFFVGVTRELWAEPLTGSTLYRPPSDSGAHEWLLSLAATRVVPRKFGFRLSCLRTGLRGSPFVYGENFKFIEKGAY